ncbi:MAG: hypothetical protein HUJ53_10180 [Holdemanella sp.]|nr:hypothetical protein [Holdemanella sp.]
MKKFTKKQIQILNQYRLYGIIGGFGFMIIVFLIGLLFFFRPSTSTVEKRELTKYPEFTMSSFLDGSYFSDVSLWYSDTFPLRDTFIRLNNNFKRLYGVETKTMMVGGNVQADEIPTEKSEETEKEKKEAVVPDSYMMEASVQNQIMAGLYIENGAAYGVYYFGQEAADIYIDALNNAAKELKGTTKVWSLLVPQNSSVLPEETLKNIGGSDQGQAIAYYFNSYEDVEPIPVYEDIREHRDEYLYFRTDHHWTANGAYYAYQNFCKAKGFKAEKLEDFEPYVFDTFLGSYYAELQLAEMESNPDTVYAYIPNATNEMIYEEDGIQYPYQIVADITGWNINSGYLTFVAGDRQFAMMDNPKINDGSSVLVIKESYGNCFIPYLVDHYDKVYYMDFRYTPYNVIDFCKKNKVTDLIIENNIQICADAGVASKIAELLSE